MTTPISILAVLDDKISKGLKSYLREFGNLEKGLARVEKAIAPVTSKLARLGASLISIQGARQAIQLGETQIKVEQRLLQALDGRKNKLEELKKLTSEIQEDSKIGDEVTLGVAASLLNLGVPVDQLDKSLQATVDTAAALGVSLDLAGRSIATGFSSNNIGLLARRLPDLQDELARTGDATKLVDNLLKQFGGTAAAISDNGFGELQREQNRFGDTMERIGVIIVDFVTPAMAGFADGLERIEEFLSSPVFTGAADIVGEFAPELVKIATLVAAILGGGGSLLILTPVLSSALGLVTGIASILTGLVVSAASFLGLWGTLAVAIGSILIDFKALRDFAIEIAEKLFGDFDNFKFLADGIKEGRLEFRDLFDFILQRLEIVGLRVQQFLINPVKLFINVTKDALLGIIDVVVSAIAQGLIGVIGLIVSALQATINAIINAINTLLPRAIDNVDIVGKFESATRGLEEKFSGAFDDGLDRLSTIPDTFKNAKTEAAQLAIRIQEAEKNTQEFIANAESNRASLRLEAIQREGAEFEKLDNKLQAAIGATLSQTNLGGGGISISDSLFADLTPEKIKSALEAVAGPLREELINTFQTQIDQMVQSQTGSITEIYALQLSLSQSTTAAELQAVEELIAKREEQAAQLRTNENEARSSFEATQKILDKLFVTNSQDVDLVNRNIDQARVLQENLEAVLRDQRANAEEIVGLEAKRNALAVEAFNQKQEEAKLGEQIANSLVEQIQARRDEVATFIEDINQQVDAGLLNREEGQNLQREAVAGIREEISLAIEDLIRLKEVLDPETSGAIDEIVRKLQEMNDSLPDEKTGFFNGLLAGAKETAAALSDTTSKAKQFGSDTIKSIGDQVADVAVGAGKSWKEFGKSFIDELTKMIVKLLFFKAVSAGLNFLFPGAGAAVSGVAGGANVLGRNKGGPIVNLDGHNTVPLTNGGTNVNTDSVLAHLTVGEQIVDRDTTRYYGQNFFEALKRRMIPRSFFAGGGGFNISPAIAFAGGGNVTDGSGISSGGAGQSMVVADEQSLDRLLRGGLPTLLGVLSENGIKPNGLN